MMCTADVFLHLTIPNIFSCSYITLYQSITWSRKSQLSACHNCISTWPAIITNCAPRIIPADLHTTFIPCCPIHQPDVSMHSHRCLKIITVSQWNELELSTWWRKSWLYFLSRWVIAQLPFSTQTWSESHPAWQKLATCKYWPLNSFPAFFEGL